MQWYFSIWWVFSEQIYDVYGWQCDQIWQKFISLWQFFEGLFNIWQNFEPTLSTFYVIGQKFIVVKGQILKGKPSHLVTLTVDIIKVDKLKATSIAQLCTKYLFQQSDTIIISQNQ